ncbi:hypothetical protein F4806DRAFT_496110 [Annulohypoxylon nitens]|nr:hypothetical protein F4806DRAFT_496110 [Annulohypoxylon nitens]
MSSNVFDKISLQLEEYTQNAGTVRTDINPSAGTIRRPGFSVDFEIIYEVHGSYDPSDHDNASLLVIRIIPFPKDIERQFLWFSIKLSVIPAAHKSGKPASNDYDDDDDESGILRVTSFEPASQGDQFIDVYTTNEARERMAQISAQVPITSTASLGGQYSATDKLEFQNVHTLRVNGRGDRSDMTLPHQIYNGAKWNISAANKTQGIGDSFTVALLIKRPEGSSFQLAAEVDGDVGSFSANARKLLPSNGGGRRRQTPLRTFPRTNVTQKIPPGILVGDLHRASTDNVLKTIKEIGLHLPEQATPQKSDRAAKSATNLELGLMKVPNNDDTSTQTVQRTTTNEDITLPTPPVDAGNSGKTVVDHEPIRTTSHDDQASVPPTMSLKPDTASANSLTNILQQLQVLTEGLKHSPLQTPTQKLQHPQIELSEGSLVRFKRHREIVILYERLADLHREEANEFLLPQEKTLIKNLTEH